MCLYCSSLFVVLSCISLLEDKVVCVCVCVRACVRACVCAGFQWVILQIKFHYKLIKFQEGFPLKETQCLCIYSTAHAELKRERRVRALLLASFNV